MLNLGWSAAILREYQTLLVTPHRTETITQLTDLNHNRLADVSPQFSGGQVTIDDGAEITRSVGLSFFDPQRAMHIDANSPADGAMFMDRMFAVYHRVSSLDGTRVFTVPVFRGPITKVDRDEEVVNVECMGKEALGLDPVWVTRTFKKGAYKTDVIATLLRDVGETRFSFRKSSARLTKDLAVTNQTKPWTLAKAIATGMGLQLFYDARGICVLRVRPSNIAWEYRDSGDRWSVINKPQVGYDLSGFTNAVVVKGAVPKGKKTPIIVREALPKSHPLSPWSLGRAGKPRYISREINDDSITSSAEAKTVAHREVTRGAIEAVTVSMDALPVPYLEEKDPYRLVTADFTTTAAVQRLTLPLMASDSSSVGYLRTVKTPNLSRIRRRRR